MQLKNERLTEILLSDATFYDHINTIYQFINMEPFNKQAFVKTFIATDKANNGKKIYRECMSLLHQTYM